MIGLLVATALTFQATTPTALVELFTSEGCSSCPPADEWLAKAAASDGLWKSWVPVAWHVDYWDYLGWKDSFSDPVHTERHHDYGRAWKTSTVYTPTVVADGKVWGAWRKEKEVPSRDGSAAKLTLKLEESGAFAVEAEGALPACVVAHTAVLVTSVTRKIARGENAGATLTHAFPVVAVARVALAKSGKKATGKGRVDRPKVKGAKGYAVAAWISSCASPAPLQAVGGPL